MSSKGSAIEEPATRPGAPVHTASGAKSRRRLDTLGAVSGRMTARLVHLLELEGRDAVEVCRRAGVSRDEVTSLSARVPYSVVDALVESCVRELGVAEFAVALSAVMDESTYDAAGFVLMSSETFGEGLERAFAYQRLWADGERFTLRRDAGAGVIGFEHPGRSRVARAVLAEVAFVETMNAARVLVGPTAAAESATFSHERASSLRQALGVEPIYGAKRNELVLDASLLAAPIRLPEGVLARMYDVLARRALAELPARASLASQLRAVCKLEPGAFSLDLAGIAARPSHDAPNAAEATRHRRDVLERGRRRSASRVRPRARAPRGR